MFGRLRWGVVKEKENTVNSLLEYSTYSPLFMIFSMDLLPLLRNCCAFPTHTFVTLILKGLDSQVTSGSHEVCGSTNKYCLRRRYITNQPLHGMGSDVGRRASSRTMRSVTLCKFYLEHDYRLGIVNYTLVLYPRWQACLTEPPG